MSTVWMLGRLAEDVYENSPVGVGAWERHNRMPPMKRGTNFFGAAYFHAQTKTAVVAFRGSMERSDWTDADVDIARDRLPLEQVGDAFHWTGAVKRFAGGLGYTRIFLTGHSLGGALVQVVAANLGGVIGASYNAPGMKAATTSGSVKLENKNARIYNIRLEWDPVSAKGTHLGKPVVALKNGSISPANHKIGVLLRAIESSNLALKEVEGLV